MKLFAQNPISHVAVVRSRLRALDQQLRVNRLALLVRIASTERIHVSEAGNIEKQGNFINVHRERRSSYSTFPQIRSLELILQMMRPSLSTYLLI